MTSNDPAENQFILGGQSRAFPAGTEDRALAEWLAGEMAGSIRYNYSTSEWHIWNQTIWRPDRVRDVERKVYELALARASEIGQAYLSRDISDEKMKRATKVLRLLLNESKCRNALEALATMPAYKTDGHEWDQQPALIGCKNGVLDLRTLQLDTHPDPSCNVSKSVSVPYEPAAAADTKVFRKFLLDVASQDTDLAAFYLRWFGYSLFGTNSEQRFLVLAGTGRNGKGALVHVVRHVFGDYAAAASSGVYMKNHWGATPSSSARSDLIQLKGTRLAIMSEPEGGRFNEELLKAHTGGDPIVARPLYGKEVSWTPTHTITFLTNNPPAVDDIGPSMQARIIVADFREKYMAGFRQPDLKLYDKLIGEATGVFALLVRGAYQWFTDGLMVPERAIKASDAYIAANDPLGYALAARFAFSDGASVPAKAAYEAYLDWYHDEGEGQREMLSMKAFSLLVAQRGIVRRKVNTGTVYLGIRLKNAVELAVDEEVA